MYPAMSCTLESPPAFDNTLDLAEIKLEHDELVLSKPYLKEKFSISQKSADIALLLRRTRHSEFELENLNVTLVLKLKDLPFTNDIIS